jgi:hypothetical protein
MKALVSIQSDAYYGGGDQGLIRSNRKRQPIVRSGFELVAFDVLHSRIGVRHDHETEVTATDFGFGLSYGHWRVGRHSMAVSFDLAWRDDQDPTHVYTVIASLSR